MRTTVDIPNNLMKKAKIKAIEEGISLKELFIQSLENHLGDSSGSNEPPWKKLKGMGSSSQLSPDDSGFEGYSGPDWNQSLQVNEDP